MLPRRVSTRQGSSTPVPVLDGVSVRVVDPSTFKPKSVVQRWLPPGSVQWQGVVGPVFAFISGKGGGGREGGSMVGIAITLAAGDSIYLRV